MERILNEITAGQGLVVREHDAVVLGVGLVAALRRPFVSLLLLWRESPDVVGKHVEIRSVVDDPMR